uniref:Uncharacterized protein n=1 Tax=Sphaerodactylus townsendi TaxID=933632 RepID=A0ACB8EBR1_9SAUR
MSLQNRSHRLSRRGAPLLGAQAPWPDEEELDLQHWLALDVSQPTLLPPDASESEEPVDPREPSGAAVPREDDIPEWPALHDDRNLRLYHAQVEALELARLEWQTAQEALIDEKVRQQLELREEYDKECKALYQQLQKDWEQQEREERATLEKEQADLRQQERDLLDIEACERATAVDLQCELTTQVVELRLELQHLYTDHTRWQKEAAHPWPPSAQLPQQPYRDPVVRRPVLHQPARDQQAGALSPGPPGSPSLFYDAINLEIRRWAVMNNEPQTVAEWIKVGNVIVARLNRSKGLESISTLQAPSTSSQENSYFHNHSYIYKRNGLRKVMPFGALSLLW